MGELSGVGGEGKAGGRGGAESSAYQVHEEVKRGPGSGPGMTNEKA